MLIPSRFTKLMKGEPKRTGRKRIESAWIIDESKYLFENEIGQLRKYCAGDVAATKKRKFNKLRDWFMIELGLNTGLRVSEMADLKHENLLLDNFRSSIIVQGKGNKKRAIWISSIFKRSCQEYTRLKNGFGLSTDEDRYLLNNPKGNKITKRALQKAFKKLVEKAGLPSHYHIHCLRHTYTTFLLKASQYNYRFVQRQLGHASIRTTQSYAGVLESEGKRALEKLYR